MPAVPQTLLLSWQQGRYLHREARVAAVHVDVRLVLIAWPLARRSRHPVLRLGGREGEVLPGVGLSGDGVSFRSGCRWLLLWKCQAQTRASLLAFSRLGLLEKTLQKYVPQLH